jgi:hypothetical protein
MLTRRFFRAELTRHYTLDDGTRLCVGRKALFRKGKEDENFTRCFRIMRGTRPLKICICSNGFLFFGEYFSNRDRKEVHIYGSYDRGKSWEIAYTFPENEINHVHGIFQDPWYDQLWIVTGDLEDECIIATTANYFKSINIVFRGGQEFRTTTLYFYPEHISFATDSEHIHNRIRSFNRKSLEIKDISEVQGSVIKGGQCGNLSYFSTAVEKSDANRNNNSYIWISSDGLCWQEVYSDSKDILPSPIFQIGTFEFPEYRTTHTKQLYFNGRALKKTDGKTMVLPIDI